MREELYRRGATEDEQRAIEQGGRAGSAHALGLRIERALVAGAVELDDVGEWRPTEVRVDPDADETSTRGTAGARELLVITRDAGRRTREDSAAGGPSSSAGGAVPSLHTLARTYDETVAEQRERAWAYDTVHAELGNGATLIALEERGNTLAAELGQVRLLALGSDFDGALAPVSEAMLGVVTPIQGSRRLVSSTTSVDVGDTLDGKYELVEKLGQGGFGAVYRAIDRDLDTEVAVKLLRAELAKQEAALEEFRAEARRVAKLEHPNIVGWKGFNAGSEAGPYFVMEFLRGTELVHVVRSEHNLPLPRVKRILHQVLQALVAAHYPGSGEQVLHLDLKPQNIFLTQAPDGSETAKVIDFGIGKLTGRAGERSGPGEPSLEQHAHLRTPGATLSVATRGQTTTASVACTPEYASPEQARNMLAQAEVARLDDRSDLYSFGVVAFELLTGDLPFERLPREARLEYLDRHIETPPRRVRDLRGDVDRRLSDFVGRCLAKRPEDRFESTREALAEFERILAAKRNSALIAVASVAGVLILTLAGMLVFRGAGGVRPLDLNRVTEDGVASALGDRLFVDARSDAGLLVAVSGTALELGETLRLMSIDDRELEGWELVPEPERGLGVHRLRPTRSIEGREAVEARVVVDGDGPRRRSDPFELVALGRRAVELEALRIGGAEVGDDPLALALGDVRLTVDLRGERVDLESDGGRVRFCGPDGVWRDLDHDYSRDGVVHWKRQIGDTLGLGVQRCEIEVVDAAGVERDRRRFELRVLPERPSRPVLVAGAPLVDGKLSLHQGLEGSLSFRSDPDTTVEVRVLRGLSDGGTLLRELSDGGRADFPVDRIWSLGGERLGRHTGELIVSAEYFGVVGGVASEELRLDYGFDPDPPQLAGLELLGGAGSDDGRSVTTRERAAVRLTRSNDTPIEVELRVVVPDRPELGATHQVTISGARSREIELTFPDLGTYAISARVMGGPAQADGRVSQSIEVVRVPREFGAKLGLGEFELGAAVLLRDVSGDTVFPAPRVELAAAALVPLPMTAELANGTRVIGRWSGTLEPGRRSIALEPSGELDPRLAPDGRYRLQLSIDDPAGRRGPSPLDVELARSAPEVAVDHIVSAIDDGRWKRSPRGTFRLELTIQDPNGIQDPNSPESVAPRVRLQPASMTASALGHVEQELVAVSRRPDATGRFSTEFELSRSWSEQPVELFVDVSDAHGNRYARVVERTTLDEIELEAPSYIELSVPSAEHRSTPMALVRDPNRPTPFKHVLGDLFEQQGPLGGDDFPAYYLDVHEVTVEQFRAFLEDAEAGYLDPRHWPRSHQPSIAAAEQRRREILGQLDADGRAPGSPMVGVQWAEACAYAHYVGKRLPSYLEWQFAVRGSEGRRWSGDGQVTWENAAAHYAGSFDRPADKTPDRTPEGLRGLCSGPTEWTSTPASAESVGIQNSSNARIKGHFQLDAEENRRALLSPSIDSGDVFRIVAPDVDHDANRAPEYDSWSRRSSVHSPDTSDIGFRCALGFLEYEQLLDQQRARKLSRTLFLDSE